VLPVRRRKSLPRCARLVINLLFGEHPPSCFGQVARHSYYGLLVILFALDPLIDFVIE
jgi:hypothetical protein